MGMFRIELAVPGTPVDVHGYLVDLAHHPEWRFDVRSSALAGGLTGGVGARYEQHLDAPDGERVVEAELTESQRPDLVAFRALGGRETLTVVTAVAPHGDGSGIVLGLEQELGRPLLGRRARGADPEERTVRYGRALAEALGGSVVD
jgi:hypothetical protein